MKQAWWIFSQDIKRLFSNWIVMLVVGGVCLLPSLYAWFNIAANMDPYGKTEEIKVAIVNLDKAAKKDGENINAGERIVKALKANKQLGWCFVDEDKAMEGVKSGEYYAAIVIPKNFSSSMISILSGKLDRPQIDYYVNDKENAIAPKITDTGATTVQQDINDTFSSIASEAVADIIKNIAVSFSKNVDTNSEDALTAISQTQSNLQSGIRIMTQLQSNVNGASSKIIKAITALNKVEREAQASAVELANAETALKQARDSMSEFSGIFFRTMSNSQSGLNNLYNRATNHLNTLDINGAKTAHKLDKSIDTLNNLNEKNQKLLDSLKQLEAVMPEIDPLSEVATNGINNLKNSNEQFSDMLKSLKEQGANFDALSQAGKNAENAIKNLKDNSQQTLQKYSQSYEEDLMPELNKALDSLAYMMGILYQILEDVTPAAEQTKTLLYQLDTNLTSSSGALDKSKASLISINSQLGAVASDIHTLRSSALYKKILSAQNINVEDVSDFMYSPVEVESDVLYPVKNYGSAMTPFYTNLAIWVGGLILASIFKQEVNQRAYNRKFTPTQAYCGRWFLFVVLGLVQSFFICLGDVVLLKIQCIHPVYFICAGLFCSFIYVSLVYALAIAFKHIGKAFAVILVILQIPGSSGTYPIQMMPEFFQRIYPLLPFTYGIDAMRETIAGMYDHYYAKNMLILLMFLVVALIIGLCFRPALMNLNHLFDKKLEETEIMVGETDSVKLNRPHLRLIINALLNDEKGKEAFMKRWVKFERKYPKLIKYGLRSMLIIPSIFLILMFGLESKLIFLILWIAFIVGLAVYLIVVEYMHNRIEQELSLSGLASEDLIAKMKEDRE